MIRTRIKRLSEGRRRTADKQSAGGKEGFPDPQGAVHEPRLRAKIGAGLAKVARRDVLITALNFAWVAPLAVGVWELFKFMRYEPPTTGGTQFTLGKANALPRLPGYIESAQVWLLIDAKGYYAVDAICTHLGCTVRLESNGEYACRCHGSRFETDGDVINGPATKPLRFLRLYWGSSGQLTVDRATVVGSDVRLAPG